MHRCLWVLVAHSLFIEGSHMTKNTASVFLHKCLIHSALLSRNFHLIIEVIKTLNIFSNFCFHRFQLGLSLLQVGVGQSGVKIIKFFFFVTDAVAR